MKLYKEVNGEMFTAEVPDGAERMERGRRDNRDTCITSVDYQHKTFRERVYGQPPEVLDIPFPEHWYTDDSLTWTPHTRLA